MRYQFIFLLSLFTSQLPAQAGDIKVSVSRDTIFLGNAFFIQYTISRNDVRFHAPEFQGSHILSQSTMSNTSVQDGKVQFMVTHRYLVQPERAGVFTIPAITLAGTGAETTIPAIEIYVHDNPGGLQEDPEGDPDWINRDAAVKIPVRKTRKL